MFIGKKPNVTYTGGGAGDLDGLSDVIVSSPQHGQILVYNAVTMSWQNQVPATGTIYTLPVASSTLGGVLSGTDITVDSAGNVSVVDDSHNHVISNVDGLQDALDAKALATNVLTPVPVNALFTDTVYVHPTDDGSHHVPATGTSNSGKVLTAGATAGSESWQDLPSSSSGVSALTALTDVLIAAPQNKQVLGYDVVSKTWKNMSMSSNTTSTVIESGRDGIPDIDFSGTPDYTIATTTVNGTSNNTSLFTAAFSACSAITDHTPLLYIPKPSSGASYMIEPLTIPSNIKILIEAGVTITAYTAGGAYSGTSTKAMFKCVGNGATNISIRGNGATIKYPTLFPYSTLTQEKFFIFYFSNSQLETSAKMTDFYIDDLVLDNAWADGLYINGGQRFYVENVTITNFARNAVSIIDLETSVFYNCVFEDWYYFSTNVQPGAGIDFEPNYSWNKLYSINIRRCSANNCQCGFNLSLGNMDGNTSYDTTFPTGHTYAGSPTYGAGMSAVTIYFDVVFEYCSTYYSKKWGYGGLCYFADPGSTVYGNSAQFLQCSSDSDGWGNSYGYPFYCANETLYGVICPKYYVQNPIITNWSTNYTSWRNTYATAIANETDLGKIVAQRVAVNDTDLIEVKLNVATTIDPTNTIDNLENVSITDPVDGQSLVYDATAKVWKNSTIKSSSSSALDKLADVDVPTFGVPDVYLNTYSPAGDNVTNDTSKFSSAFAACNAITDHVPVLYIDKPSVAYKVNRLEIPSHIKIVFEEGTILEGDSTYTWNTKGILNIQNATNTSIRGNGVILRSPDTEGHSETVCSGLSVITSTDVYIEDVHVSHPWMDAFYLSGNTRCCLYSCYATDWHRQGFTVIGGYDNYLVDCEAYQTTAKLGVGDGFHVEPNSLTDVLSNIQFRYCKSSNGLRGFAASLGQWQTAVATMEVSMTYNHCTSYSSTSNAFHFGNFYLNTYGISGQVNLLSPYSDAAGGYNIFVENDYATYSPIFYIENPSYDNPSSTQTTWATTYSTTAQKYVAVEVVSARVEIVTDVTEAGTSTNIVMSGLSDVLVTSPTNGNILIYDSSTSKWTNTNTLVSPLISGKLGLLYSGQTDFVFGSSTAHETYVETSGSYKVWNFMNYQGGYNHFSSNGYNTFSSITAETVMNLYGMNATYPAIVRTYTSGGISRLSLQSGRQGNSDESYIEMRGSYVRLMQYRNDSVKSGYIIVGDGSPEGVTSFTYGTMYIDVNSTSSNLYIKNSGSGNTGWQKCVALPASVASALTAGDLIYYNGTSFQKVAGTKTDGYTIKLVSGVPTWSA